MLVKRGSSRDGVGSSMYGSVGSGQYGRVIGV